MLASDFIKEGHTIKLVLSEVGLGGSSYYYKPKASSGVGGKKGKAKSKYTYTKDGVQVCNSIVVEQIKDCLSDEFVDYGYLKMTHWLRQEKNYVINAKKVYRLMSEAGILNKFKPRPKSKRRWVKNLLPDTKVAFDYMEFDIKYIYVAGQNRNALLLTVIDVKTRWILGQVMKWNISQKDVRELFDQIFSVYPLPKSIYVRSDNGSQFIANKVQLYFEKMKGVTQEFCKPATPEQNAHIESYHSIIEKVVCQRNEFDDLNEAQQTFNRFVKFYNYKRIHSGVEYTSPYRFLLQCNIDMKSYDLECVLDCMTTSKLTTTNILNV